MEPTDNEAAESEDDAHEPASLPTQACNHSTGGQPCNHHFLSAPHSHQPRDGAETDVEVEGALTHRQQAILGTEHDVDIEIINADPCPYGEGLYSGPAKLDGGCASAPARADLSEGEGSGEGALAMVIEQLNDPTRNLIGSKRKR